jgi:hypothetical protein
MLPKKSLLWYAKLQLLLDPSALEIMVCLDIETFNSEDKANATGSIVAFLLQSTLRWRQNYVCQSGAKIDGEDNP